MHVVGLITEHNPFHNGHLYHLQKAKKLAKAPYVISVMSGNFLQRGEPALVNKWARAEMAVKAGVDLVIEIPASFATRSAPSFAYGSVKVLDDCGLVTHLCFGSEGGDIEALKRIADILVHEPPRLSALIKKYLSTGVIYPVAQNEAIKEYMQETSQNNYNNLQSVATSPNNILGIEYLKSLLKLGSSIIPLTIKRVKNQYHDKDLPLQHGIASATSIRQQLLKQTSKNELKNYFPNSTAEILEQEFKAGRGPVFTSNLTQLGFYSLRIKKDTLKDIVDVSEGLEQRIISAAKKTSNYNQLLNTIKTKRYTWTKLQRILIHHLLEFTQAEADLFQKVGPQYIRVLAFNSNGQELLNKMKKTAKVPVVTHISPYYKKDGIIRQMLELDIKASDLYTLLYQEERSRQASLDFLKHPVFVTS